jgi:Tfp pilus assembly protein PilP
MRLAKSSRTLLPLALSAVLATCALAQDSPNAQSNAARDQLKQVPGDSQPTSAAKPPVPSPAPAKQSAPAATPAKSPAAAKEPVKAPAKAPAPAAAPATTSAKPPAAVQESAKAPAKAPAPAAVPAAAPTKAPAAPKESAKAPAKAPAPPAAAAKAPTKVPAPGVESAKAASENPAKPPVEKPVEEKPVVRRDPFDTLLTKARAGNAPPENLPPGKAGLIVETLNIDGIVRSPNGMIAIVSNSQRRVYFLREGDKLYDGSVEKIALDAIAFHEIGKDAFGKPLERVVTKRLYPSSGEQQ